MPCTEVGGTQVSGVRTFPKNDEHGTDLIFFIVSLQVSWIRHRDVHILTGQ
jgi:hypothetical protein